MKNQENAPRDPLTRSFPPSLPPALFLFLSLSPFFFSSVSEASPDHPCCNAVQSELAASFSHRVALPPSSDFPLASFFLPPSRARSRAGLPSLFLPFPFSQSTSDFLDVAQAKRQHRIAQRPARLLSRPASTPKREVCIFTRRVYPLASRRPERPTDRPTNQATNQPTDRPTFLFRSPGAYTCYIAW